MSRHEARQRALDFSWQRAAQQFADFLVPARDGRPAAKTSWQENSA